MGEYTGGFHVTPEGRRVPNDPNAYARSLVEKMRRPGEIEPRTEPEKVATREQVERWVRKLGEEGHFDQPCDCQMCEVSAEMRAALEGRDE